MSNMARIGSDMRRGRDEHRVWWTASEKCTVQICKTFDLRSYLTLVTQPNQVHLQSVIWVPPRIGVHQKLWDCWLLYISLALLSHGVQSRHQHGHRRQSQIRIQTAQVGNIMHVQCNLIIISVWDASNRNSQWERKKVRQVLLKGSLVSTSEPSPYSLGHYCFIFVSCNAFETTKEIC